MRDSLFVGGEVSALLPPLIMLITPTCWSVFTLGTDCCSFSLVLVLLPLFLFIPHWSPPSHTFSLTNLPPFHPQLSPLCSWLVPWGNGWGKERQRETGQACTVENIVYARHKAACNFCSGGDAHEGREGGGAGSWESRQGKRQAGSQAELKPQHECNRISRWGKSQHDVLQPAWGFDTGTDYRGSKQWY